MKGSPFKFVNAVIDEAAFDKITGYIQGAQGSDDAKIIGGGNFSKKKGYFVEPTIILTRKPDYASMDAP
jgi:1-pyrroline-5-carboxylate dehydrogenase